MDIRDLFVVYAAIAI